MADRLSSFSTQQHSDNAGKKRDIKADIEIDLENITTGSWRLPAGEAKEGVAPHKTAGERMTALRAEIAARSPRFAEAMVLERHAEAFCETVRSGLKAIREARDLTQGELGKRIDLSQSAVSKIESGDGDLSLKTLYRMAYALEVIPVVSMSAATGEGRPRENAQNDRVAREESKTAVLAAVEAALMERLPQFLASVVDDLRNEKG